MDERGDADLRRALAALARAADERVARHPLGHLTGGRDALELTLTVPLGIAGEPAAELVERAGERLRAELDAHLAHRSVFQPGRVFCLRCSSTGCEHAAPAGPRQVFAGYGPTGIPRFEDFGQWLLERQHPEVDRLFRKPPPLLTAVSSGHDLCRELLAAYRDREIDFRLHGQVAAGWFALPGPDGHRALQAVAIQVLSSAGPAGGDRRARGKKRGRAGGKRGRAGAPRRRLGLNVVGAGPGGEDLSALYRRLDEVPWTSAVAWAQGALQNIERAQGRPGTTPEKLSRRVEGVLGGIARRLEHRRRARDRRTRHAQARHRAGDRPTRMALSDLAQADGERVLVDTRNETLIVLGERGRAHVFNDAGKIVTSIRYSPESIARKREREIWRPAAAEEIAKLREMVG